MRASLATLLLAMGLSAAWGAFSGPVAFADNTLVSSNPANGATLSASPTSMAFTFAEPLGPTNTVVVSCNGEPFSVGGATLNADGLSLAVAVPNAMPRGTCNVIAQVSAPDSSPNGRGDISFDITADAPEVVPEIVPEIVSEVVSGVADTITPGAASTATAAAPTAEGAADATADGAPPRVGGPLGLSRLIAMLGLAVLFGSLVLVVTAWPEGVEYILTVRFLRTVWVASVAGSVLVAVFLTAQTSGRSVGASINPLAWRDLTDAGASGVAALLRVVLAAACGWVVTRPERILDPATQLPALAIPALAVATFGLSRTGGDLALVGVVAGIGHAIAMSIWLGGLVLLSRVVLAGPGDDDLVHAVRGFSRIATPALLATIVTGAIQTWRLDRGALFDSSHGRVMLLKALAVGAMVFVGLLTRQFVQARLRTADVMTVPLSARLRRATGVEAAGGVLVLLLTAWMLSLTPAGLVDAGTRAEYGYSDGRFAAEGLDVTVSVTGRVGPNGVRVEVVEPAAGLSNMVIRFIPPAGTTAAEVILTLPAEFTGTGAAVLDEAEGVPLGVAGVWTLDLSVTTPNGPVTAQKTFTVLA